MVIHSPVCICSHPPHPIKRENNQDKTGCLENADAEKTSALLSSCTPSRNGLLLLLIQRLYERKCASI